MAKATKRKGIKHVKIKRKEKWFLLWVEQRGMGGWEGGAASWVQLDGAA